MFTLGHIFSLFFAIEKILKIIITLYYYYIIITMLLLLLLFNLLSRASNMIVFSC